MFAKVLIETDHDVFLKNCHRDEHGNYVAILSDEPFNGHSDDTVELLRATLYIDGLDASKVDINEYMRIGTIRLLKISPEGDWLL